MVKMLWDSAELSSPAGLQQVHHEAACSQRFWCFLCLFPRVEPSQSWERLTGLGQATWLKVTLPILTSVVPSVHACPWTAL